MIAVVPIKHINFGEHPQGKPLPAIVMLTVSNDNTHHMEGPTRLYAGRVQVDCYGDDYLAAKTVSRSVLAALDGYAGGGFQGIFHAGSRDTREGGANETARPYRVSMDFMTQWSEKNV